MHVALIYRTFGLQWKSSSYTKDRAGPPKNLRRIHGILVLIIATRLMKLKLRESHLVHCVRKKQIIILSDDGEPLTPKSGEQDTKRPKKKRPIMDVEMSETELDTKVEPPFKRGRHESASTSTVRRSKIKKYTRKRSPSSPAVPFLLL